mmetsp:Transcript_19953/g.49030  ORF Transcript_19953/g.49030 Transcript_19953/m.49030 type:complete len:82 (+) Transcript_19953:125-370(+)
MSNPCPIKFAVDGARIPSLPSFAPKLKPSTSVETMNAEIPLCLLKANLILDDAGRAASWEKKRNSLETLADGCECTAALAS